MYQVVASNHGRNGTSRPSHAFIVFFVIFLLFCFFHSVSFLCFILLSTFFGCTYVPGMYHGYVPGIVSLQVIRNGIPLLVSAVPFRTGTAVHVLFCFFHRDVSF